MRFVIYAPPWRHNSAGVNVLHRLCHQLNAAGFDACITGKGNPLWNEPNYEGPKEGDFMVYPDIVTGNPLNADKIIRYMLYYPWAYFSGKRILKGELLIPFCGYILPSCKQYCDYEIDESYCLEVSIIEPWLFKYDPEIKKDINTFWVGKGGGNKKDFNLPKDAVDISGDITREEVAKLLQRSKNHYCFDYNSAISAEACLCGANTFIITGDAPPRVIQMWFRSHEENEFMYNDLHRYRKFAHLADNFFRARDGKPLLSIENYLPEEGDTPRAKFYRDLYK